MRLSRLSQIHKISSNVFIGIGLGSKIVSPLFLRLAASFFRLAASTYQTLRYEASIPSSKVLIPSIIAVFYNASLK